MSKLLVFAALVSLAWAQSVTSEGSVMPESSPVMPETSAVMPSSSDAALPVPTSTVVMDSSIIPSATPTVNANSSLAERFNAAQAMSFRNNHFYCLNETETGFREEMNAADGSLNPVYWSVMLQYPVLSFLDVRRKANLIDVIARLVRRGADSTSAANNLMPEHFCIGPVDHYRVSYYDESVLIRFYFNDIIVTPYDTTSGVTIRNLNRFFMAGFRAAIMDTADNDVVTFMGRYALAISPVIGFISENVHPGGVNLTDSEDPTLRAVLISHLEGNRTISDALASENRYQNFANNPRPINFGLEPGDIVFAVFGSIFLAIVGFLTILGFCIHPFFLA